LGAIQLVPTIELAPRTVRGNLAFDFLSGGFLPHELVGLFIPKAFDGATPLYVGAAALAFALVGLATGPSDPRRYAAVLTAWSLPLALGKYSAVYPLAYLTFPGFAQVRDQERAILLLTLGISILAGNGVYQVLCRAEPRAIAFAHALTFPLAAALAAGGATSLVLATQLHEGFAQKIVDTIDQAREGLDWTLLVVVAVLAVLLVAALTRRQLPVLAWIVAALCALDLLSAHPGYETVPGNTNLYPSNPLIAKLQAGGASPFRISSEGLLPAGGNAGFLFGLEDIVGNSPLELSSFHVVSGLPEPQRWAVLDVRYVLTKRASIGDAYPLLGTWNGINLFESPAASRAWLVHSARVVAPNDAAAALATAQFHTEAIVEGPVALTPATGPESVQVSFYAPDHLELQATVSSPALLVMSQIAYPGWHATVDGSDTPLHIIDGAVYGLPLPAGTHRVTLDFAPQSFTVGQALTRLTLLVLVLLGVWPLLQRAYRRLRRTA
jgi:hypothetical protein